MVAVEVVMFVNPSRLLKTNPPVLHEDSGYQPWFAFFSLLPFTLLSLTHATVICMRGSYFIVIHSLALPLDLAITV